MRVDSSPPGAAAASDLDPLSQVRRYFQALRRSWWVLLVAMILGAALGWLTTPGPPPPVHETIVTAPPSSGYFKAVHSVLQNTDYEGGGFQSTNLSQAAYLVANGDVPALVATALGLTRSEVEASVGATPKSEVSSIEITAIGNDPEKVVSLADTSAMTLIAHLDERAKAAFDGARDEIIGRLDRLEGEIADINVEIMANPDRQTQLEAQQRSLSNQYSTAYEQFTQIANTPVPTSGLSSLQVATAEGITDAEYDRLSKDIREGLTYQGGTPTTAVEESSTPSRSTPSEGASAGTRAGFGAVVGLALAIAGVLTLDRFDSKLRHREQVESATGLPVLAEIPSLSRQQQSSLAVVAHSEPRGRAAEAYRVVRSALLFAVEAARSSEKSVAPPDDEPEGLVVMVTSANPAEGKTTTVANLAAVLAEGGYSVLVINCDFRRPRVQKYLVDGTEERGVEIPTANGKHSVYITKTAIDGVMLVTGVGEHDDEANPLDVIATQRLIVQKARPRYDVVLLDTAPFLTTNDASELLSETDQVLVVVRGGKTRRLAAARTAEFLARFDAPVVGVIMNDSSETPAAQYYYSYYLDAAGKGKRGRSGAQAESAPRNGDAARSQANGNAGSSIGRTAASNSPGDSI